MPRKLDPYVKSITGKKYCRGCENWKDKDEFYRNRKHKDGLSDRCKTCDNARVNAFYETHSDKFNKKRREAYQQKKGKEQPKPTPIRPLEGPRCRCCGKVLYHYEVERGECFCHTRKRLIDWHNQPVKYTQPQHAAEGD